MRQLLIAIDQLANCFVFIPGDGFGMADETLSARLFRCHLQGVVGGGWYRVIDALLFWDANHCYESWRYSLQVSLPSSSQRRYILT